MNIIQNTREKKKWNLPIIKKLGFRQTLSGQTSTWPEETNGVGYAAIS